VATKMAATPAPRRWRRRPAGAGAKLEEAHPRAGGLRQVDFFTARSERDEAVKPEGPGTVSDLELRLANL